MEKVGVVLVDEGFDVRPHPEEHQVGEAPTRPGRVDDLGRDVVAAARDLAMTVVPAGGPAELDDGDEVAAPLVGLGLRRGFGVEWPAAVDKAPALLRDVPATALDGLDVRIPEAEGTSRRGLDVRDERPVGQAYMSGVMG